MQITERVSLAQYTTMRLGGVAAYACDVTTRMELLQALSWAGDQKLPVEIIGGGSNIIWRDEGFSGLLIVNKILHFEIYDEDELNAYVTIGAGEPWDSVVERCVAAGLTGIEALSLIPGSSGATPIQNVGAYGQDISQTLTTIEAFDTVARDFVTIPGYDCGFGYRTSRFKTSDRGRFFISAVTLHLSRTAPVPPFYPAVASYLAEHQLPATPANLRQAVMYIRTTKLPNPVDVGNTGSFFSNPVVPLSKFTQLQAEVGEIPHWKTATDDVKLSGAWLIEQAGYKDYHDPETGMGTWTTQPLVIINEHAKTTADLLAFKKKIVDAVQAKFGIVLEQEPELLPLAG